MRNLSEEIINRYLTGQCSEEELIKVNAWISESDENARQLFRMEEIIWVNSTIMPMNREWLMRKKGFINNCLKRKRRKIKYCICIAG